MLRLWITYWIQPICFGVRKDWFGTSLLLTYILMKTGEISFCAKEWVSGSGWLFNIMYVFRNSSKHCFDVLLHLSSHPWSLTVIRSWYNYRFCLNRSEIFLKVCSQNAIAICYSQLIDCVRVLFRMTTRTRALNQIISEYLRTRLLVCEE